jgi:hypothetical protein
MTYHLCVRYNSIAAAGMWCCRKIAGTTAQSNRILQMRLVQNMECVLRQSRTLLLSFLICQHHQQHH